MGRNMIFKVVAVLFCFVSPVISFGGNGNNCYGFPKAKKYLSTIFGSTLSNTFACNDVLELAINATIDKVNNEHPELGKMGFICSNYSQGADIGKYCFLFLFYFLISLFLFSKKSS
jgi:hypothetical protein